MRRNRKINWLLVAVIGLHVNMFVFLLTDYSLWYFFGAMVFIFIFAWVMSNLEKRSRFREAA